MQPMTPPPGTMTTCYRHPDRRAGVSCQRCKRPICPSCMISASVGFQCPECAHAGAKAQQLVEVHRQATRPVVTSALIAVNLVVFVVGNVLRPSIGGLPFDVKFSLIPGAIAGEASGGFSDANGEWWRIITSGFMHANVLHLAMNMYALWIVGSALESVIGRLRFGVIYGVSLVGGSLGAILLSNPSASTVGASGAIFGLFATLVVLQLSRGISPWQGGIMTTILLNLVLTFAIPQISKGGHIGGLIFGALAAFGLLGASVSSAAQRERAIKVLTPVVVLAGVAMFAAAVWAANYVTVNGPLLSLSG